MAIEQPCLAAPLICHHCCISSNWASPRPSNHQRSISDDLSPYLTSATPASILASLPAPPPLNFKRENKYSGEESGGLECLQCAHNHNLPPHFLFHSRMKERLQQASCQSIACRIHLCHTHRRVGPDQQHKPNLLTSHLSEWPNLLLASFNEQHPLQTCQTAQDMASTLNNPTPSFSLALGSISFSLMIASWFSINYISFFRPWSLFLSSAP